MDRGELLNHLFAAAGGSLDSRRCERFLTYLWDLQRRSRTLRLTSISDEAGIIRRHIDAF